MVDSFISDLIDDGIRQDIKDSGLERHRTGKIDDSELRGRE